MWKKSTSICGSKKLILDSYLLCMDFQPSNTRRCKQRMRQSALTLRLSTDMTEQKNICLVYSLLCSCNLRNFPSTP